MKILFKGIVGSQSYGLATETSDTDIKFVYQQSNEDILSNKYIPQKDITKDEVGYEVRRFLELLSTGNPNVLELLYLPEHCILESSPEFEMIKENRDIFLSKKCYSTYSGYALGQLKKASGLNKKFNWEKERTIRKTPIDFATITDRQSGATLPLTEWLDKEEYTQEMIGLSKVDKMRDTYKLYTDDIKWVSDNHRFSEILEDRNYKGFENEISNEPLVSEIEAYRKNDWKGIVYWNREHYSTHCKEYRDYEKWLKNRNPHRTVTNKKHGQDLDGKNIMHTTRLILTAQEIPTEKRINVDRTKNREYLLSIKHGDVDLKSIVKEWEEKVEDLRQIYDESDLPEEVNLEQVRELELKIRNYGAKG